MSQDVFGPLSMLVLMVLYFLPSINAYGRGHHQKHPILTINLFLGWTVLGWVIALAWSSSAIHTHGYLDVQRR